ncbi:MAG TPA: TadE/TadG family type IV pilus assembly protein [Candidatus Limnocylindria bacterium]|nr:TadE/TadG family type IV pilus assembly protein [Candidatus Limnocylindria bacterium]
MGRIFRFVHAWHDDLGQSMVELALLLPVLVFGLIGGADLARAYALQLAVQNGARAGAESYAIDFTPTPAEAVARSMDEMSRTPGMDPNFATITVTVAQSDGLTPCISPPTVATPCFVTVQVEYQFRTIVPWPLVPNVANFNRMTTMRTFY